MKKNLLENPVALLAMVASLLAFDAHAMAEICSTTKEVTLFAGQTIDAGTVTISNEENNLSVTFTSQYGWMLSETHLHVADSLAGIPSTKKGNPKIGNFIYQEKHTPNVTEYTYTIEKSKLNLDANNSIIIAAHAVLVQIDNSGSVIASETGWADGKRFVSRGSWATYTSYNWQECNAEGCNAESTESAFSYGGQEYATCFIDADFDNDGTDDGIGSWGWSNGVLTSGTYTFGIYTGAEQCDLSKGTNVGDLLIDYNGNTAVITYNMTKSDVETGIPYTMVETHLYVGTQPLARDTNGEYTIAPEQYPYRNDELDLVREKTFTINDLSDGIYVVSHATISGFLSEDSTECTSEEPTEGGSEEPTEGSSEEPTEDSSDEPTEGGSDEPTEGSSEEPTEGSSEEPTEGSSEEPTEDGSDEPTEGGSDEPTEGGSDEPTEGGSDEPTEGGSDEPTEGGSEESTEGSYEAEG